MVKTTSMFKDELKEYAFPKSKLARMARSSECFPIRKGLYETDPTVPGYLLAGSIYGPSYISFDYALGFYDMIPEAVYTVTSATFDKKKKKKYETAFGTFTYRDVPSKVFPLGIRLLKEGEYYYWIAEPEKALCDKLYTLSPVSNTKELFQILTEFLRIEDTELKELDVDKICEYSKIYHTTNISKLYSLLRRI